MPNYNMLISYKDDYNKRYHALNPNKRIKSKQGTQEITLLCTADWDQVPSPPALLP